VAAEARIIKVFFAIYKDDLKKSGTAFLIINQIRAQIGGFTGHGPQESIPGGWAPKFYAWIIARVNSPKAILKHGEIVAKIFSVKVRKNKLAPAGRKAEFTVFLDGNNAPDVWGELASVGKALGVFTKEDGITPAAGGYWYFEGEKLAVGEANVLAMLKANQELAERVVANIRVAMSAKNEDYQLVPAEVEAEDTFEEEEQSVTVTDGEERDAA
jgi:RecA/RadA recombinase